ncbi:hypothetical protein ACELLULO517_07540 [Acidisoma cellulosilytica]|uniref:Uncharacterized protein n=1 Tax=Acidisoma cellulosilyticum TaxID=2802395 RepID=A0A964E3M0_9PROT|nr:hypothetical protein [Acidisoma cellulosilyticum]MCB8880083.1 hypothetical protein [Acidisoma cellulosilyticum]
MTEQLEKTKLPFLAEAMTAKQRMIINLLDAGYALPENAEALADFILQREANILDTARRAVDALGGSYPADDEHGEGYDEALGDVIQELEKIGAKDRYLRGQEFVG